MKNIHEEPGGSRQGVTSEKGLLTSHSPVAHNDARGELRVLRAAFRNTKWRGKSSKRAQNKILPDTIKILEITKADLMLKCLRLGKYGLSVNTAIKRNFSENLVLEAIKKK